MRKGMWTSYFIDLVPEDMVKEFARGGWPELELSDEHGKALLDRGDPASVGKAFRGYASDHGVAFPQGHLWLAADLAADDGSAVMCALRKWLDLYMSLGVEAAVLHPGGREMMDRGGSAEELLERRVGRLGELVHHASGSNLRICLENMSAHVTGAEDLLEIIDHVGSSQLGICLDTGHLHLARKSQREFILTAGSRLIALHLADNDGSSDQHLMPYGRGNVDWEEVMTGLKEIGYDRLMNFEIPGERRCPLPARRAKLKYIGDLLEIMWREC